MYFYNARYYDATIGRFISPDPLVGDSTNPQTLNPYSYCLNNPLLYVDPLGLDVAIVTGSCETADTAEEQTELELKYKKLVTGLNLDPGERVIYVADPGCTDAFSEGLNVQERVQALHDRLEAEHLTDITLIGFSEGAVTVGAFYQQLAQDPNYVSASVRTELRAGILLELPVAHPCGDRYNDFNASSLDNLPKRLQSDGLGNIRLVDIWNRASVVHGGSGLKGWEHHSYDSRSFLDQAKQWGTGAPFGPLGAKASELAWRTAYQSSYHNNIKQSNTAIKWCRQIV